MNKSAFATGAARVLAAPATIAHAQNYPAKPVFDRLSSETVRSVDLPAVGESLQRLSLSPAPLASGEYGALLRAEFTKMHKMFNDACIKAR